jgi:ribulose-phosphate 3-epimerase
MESVCVIFLRMNFTVLPSLLAADFGNLASEAKRAEAAGADALHLDIMDGHFVPNISMGPAVVAMAKENVSMPLNVHLMLTHPDKYAEAFHKAGADTLSIHIESECDVPETLKRIRALGMKPGITLNPDTQAEDIFPVLPLVDEVLVMTVFPGYGGQSFMPEPLVSMRAIRAYCQAQEALKDMTIMVDGGINTETAEQCAAAGANAFVAGTFLYKNADMQASIATMRKKAEIAFLENWSKQ